MTEVILKVKVAQLCLTFCDLIDYTVLGILQARILEWVAFPSPGEVPNPGIEPRSPALKANFLPAEPQGKPEVILNMKFTSYSNWAEVSFINSTHQR